MRAGLFLGFILATTLGVVVASEPPCTPATAAKKPKEDLDEKTPTVLNKLVKLCRMMHDAQAIVNDGTTNLYKVIQGHPDKKPQTKDKVVSAKLAEMQKTIIADAVKAIEMVRKDGAAVAFPEVFEQLREDMTKVQLRLETIDVGKTTRVIQEDIIKQLKEMLTTSR